jgi:UDP-N-acetylmuramate--alanine ligase
MEKIGLTKNKNILMSDYGHHPTEISKTLEALKNGYPKKKLFVIFQPHQYSRTIELLDGFKDSFSYADSVIIPNIYASRDSQENKKKINTQIFVEYIKHTNIKDGHGLTHSL